LCPACDRGTKEASELLNFLTVHNQVHADNVESCGGLIAVWVESLRQERADLDLLAREQEQWRCGEL
jgi:hypothetical protein